MVIITGVSTVVTMTGKVNGKTEILTPCKSETLKNIETKFGVNAYVITALKLKSISSERRCSSCHCSQKVLPYHPCCSVTHTLLQLSPWIDHLRRESAWASERARRTILRTVHRMSIHPRAIHPRVRQTISVLDSFEELATAMPQHQGMDELLTYFE